MVAEGSGWGSVDRAVTSYNRDPRFESSHRQNGIINISTVNFWKAEKKEKIRFACLDVSDWQRNIVWPIKLLQIILRSKFSSWDQSLVGDANKQAKLKYHLCLSAKLTRSRQQHCKSHHRTYFFFFFESPLTSDARDNVQQASSKDDWTLFKTVKHVLATHNGLPLLHQRVSQCDQIFMQNFKKVFGLFFSNYLVFIKILNLLWQIFHTFGQIFFALNGQILK